MGDYFNNGSQRRRGPTAQERPSTAHLPPEGARRPYPAREFMRPPSSIRIRRLPSSTALSAQISRETSQGDDDTTSTPVGTSETDAERTGRRRSMSAPQQQSSVGPVQFGGESVRQSAVEPSQMGTITEGQVLPQPMPFYGSEGTSRPLTPSIDVQTPGGEIGPVERLGDGANVMTEAGNAARRARGLRRFRSGTSFTHPRHMPQHDEYDSDVIDLLDLVDPEVHTLGTLTNVQNSLFIPDLGGLLNRRPTYELTPRGTDIESGGRRSRAGTRASRRPGSRRLSAMQESSPGIELQAPRPKRAGSPSSQLSDSHYAVLPHGVNLEDWSQEDIDDLNDHVRHLLHSRREGFKRSMRGFRKYISRPLGLFVFVYATLVTLFGAAWVFCLIGWIYIGDRQDYFINVIDNILVALFALIGDGLAPFRAVDTYHMCFIAHYHHLTWRLRKERQLPNLIDHNDLPDRRASLVQQEDLVDKEETAEFSVLSPRQQRRLEYHQAKFSKAHTFYKPHETSTHHAFPLRLLVAIVVLLDCHSLFQVALGTCTWSINYKVRPQALTATILSCSITCNIVAGVLISIGDHRTRKKDVLEKMHRQELTSEAIRRVQKRRTQQEDLANGEGEEPEEGRSSGTDLQERERKEIDLEQTNVLSSSGSKEDNSDE